MHISIYIGTLFWSGAKKPPSPIKFNAEDPLHIEYIIATATLRARMYGLADSTLEIGLCIKTAALYICICICIIFVSFVVMYIFFTCAFLALFLRVFEPSYGG
jgi:hypothetical protein